MTTTARHPHHQQIIDALTADPAALIEWAAKNIIALGAKAQWSNEDNWHTAETLVMLPGREYGLPIAGGQGEDDLRFYGAAARELGYDYDDDGSIECDNCGDTSESGWGDQPTCIECTDDEFVCEVHDRTHTGTCPLCAADDDEEFTCTACHRPELTCSEAPCPAVIADRESVCNECGSWAPHDDASRRHEVGVWHAHSCSLHPDNQE